MPLAERLWREVPDMREERYCFNPCYHKAFVFLCGYGSNMIDCFDPVSNSFPQPQPSVTVPESHFCCTFEQDSHLVVLAYNYMSKFSLDGNTLVKVSDKRERVCHTVWPNSPPRFLNNTVFFVENSTWCWVNMKDGIRNEVKA